MREVVLDTETTGLDPAAGHRVVEIGCVELNNHVQTGRTYWTYINPERDMPEEAFRIHGLSEAFLSEHPVFADVAEPFLEFVGDSPLVIHNADFDMRFLNAELERLGRPPLPMDRAIDTVALARRRFQGASVKLDNLCRYLGIDNSARTLHGALLDSQLLAEVYLELRGGAQQAFGLGRDGREAQPTVRASRTPRPPRPHAPSAKDLETHAAFLDRLTDPVWRRAG